MASDNESTMRWKVDIAQLKSAMADAKRSISLANAEFKNATAGMAKWQSTISGTEAKIKQLNKTNQSQKTVLENLRKQYDIVAKEMGEDSAEAQRLKVQIENQQAAIKKTDAQLDKYNSKLDELSAEQKAAQSPIGQLNSKIEEQEQAVADLKRQYANAIVGNNPEEAKRLAKEIESLSTELSDNKKRMDDAEKAADELDKSIDDAGQSAADAANGGFTVMKGALANLVAQGISAAINAARELGGALIDAGKQSIAAYAEYEQLVGGVDKLYGDASGKMQEYAANAYKTSGMSANQYMEQATSFSAALINSLDGDVSAAADLTDVAMRAMSDNVNVFGSNMTDVQNAFQGFAKQNYTMLDNLKLGYGGTKTEMERLIADANEYAAAQGMAADLSIDSFADIVTAIQLVQEEQNIAGTTAKEAASTIEGSNAMMKASWENFLVALSTGEADVPEAFNTFAESAKTYLDNLLPTVGVLMDSIRWLIEDKLREVAPEFMDFVDQVRDLFNDVLLPAFQTAFDWIIDNKDVIIAALGGILAGILAFKAVTFIQGLPAMFAALKTAILGVNTALMANPIALVVAAIAGLVAAFVILWNKSEAFRNFWLGLWEKIKSVAGTAISAVSKFFSGAWDAIKKAWAAASAFFMGIWNGIKAIFAPVISFFSTLFGNAWTMITNVWKLAVFFFTNVWNGIKRVFAPVISFFTNAFNKAWTGIKNIFAPVADFFSGIWNRITGIFSNVSGWFRTKFSAAVSAIKNVFSGIGDFFGGIWNTIKGKFSDIGQKVGSAIGGAFKSAINAVLRTAENVLNAPIRAINGLIDKINAIPGISLGKLSTFSLPRMARGGIISGARAVIAGEDGTEAIVPLEKNKEWIARVAKDMIDQLNIAGLKNAANVNLANANGALAASGSNGAKYQVINFNQTNNSPQALDRLAIYRDTKSIIFSAKVGLANV